jgi:hypothetical protein
MKQVLCAVALLALSAPLQAQDQHDMCAAQPGCRQATAAELDELRGGFEVDTGAGRLRVDIGITRQVLINDRIVATSHLSLPDLGQLVKGQGNHSMTTTVGGHGSGGNGPLLVNGLPVTGIPVITNDGGLVVQNGPNNSAPTLADIGRLAIPTIVQNTLDNQKISTLTLVNARLNSISLMNSLRLGEVMNSATARSGR